MNQILSTELEKNKNSTFNISYLSSKKKNWFKFQFGFSIFIILTCFLSGYFYYYYLKKKENLSNDLITNYNIYRLYSTSKDNSNQDNFNGLFRNY